MTLANSEGKALKNQMQNRTHNLEHLSHSVEFYIAVGPINTLGTGIVHEHQSTRK